MYIYIFTACGFIYITYPKRGSLVSRCIAVCCSVLQCVAVCCSVLQYDEKRLIGRNLIIVSSVLQCVAICCSVWQCVAMSYSVPLFLRCDTILQ